MILNHNFTDRTVVVIPSYEPPHSFIDYVKVLIAAGVAGVLVVNDGSGEKYEEIYGELRSIEGCTVLSYPENGGKGYALKYAFSYCLEHYGKDYAFVTADCDGQHLAADVLNVAEVARAHESALILGSRDFSSPNVPARSRSGNITTRRIFKFLYKLSLTDTQTGLRAFSYAMLPRLLAIKGDRFEYEMNMLVVLHKHDVPIYEVPIETVYLDKPEDVERVSHFRSVSDSARVIGTLLKNLGWYMISSTVAAVVEVVTNALLLAFVFAGLSEDPLFFNYSKQAFYSILCARILSSIFNFALNYKFVFGGKSKRSLVRYYILWAFQFAITILVQWFWSAKVTTNAILLPLLTGTCALIVALLSYQIQNYWVFPEKSRDRLHFYGPVFHGARRLFTLFSRKYKSYVIPEEGEPAIYLCRHLNMHGPYKIAQSLDFDVHMWILHPFSHFKSCFKQFSGYTFTERYHRRGFKSFLSKVGAFFAALFIPPIVRSTKEVSVYRAAAESMSTYRTALAYLLQGENTLIYPDVDYTAPASVKSEIYTGFLLLDKMYLSKTGKHIKFIPVRLDDERKTITPCKAISFSGEMPFADEMPIVAEEIRASLMD